MGSGKGSRFSRLAWAALGALGIAGPCGAQGVAEITAAMDRNAIVDCAVPGAMRKLGAGATFVMPRRVVKASAQECEVRGGEYVLFDRADPKTALKIWIQEAEAGDANALFRVGQIYEMGIAGSPDYAMAASWYQRAVAKGSRPAALNLAVLYEKGQGVKADPLMAANLYRKAQGLTDDLVSSKQLAEAQQALKQAQERVNQLEDALRRQRRSGSSTSDIERQLRDAKANMNQLLGSVDAVDAASTTRPSIQLLDPDLVTRGASEVSIRGDIKSQPVTGRVRPVEGLVSLTVNDNEIKPDRFGYFETSVPLQAGKTPLDIVAVNRAGERAELSVTLASGRAEISAPPPRVASIAPGALGSYQALVIGNNAYRYWPALQTPVEDAKSVADVLQRRYGFKVKLLTNATFEQTLNALNDYVKTLGTNDNLLIYYAGHGTFKPGDANAAGNELGYWIPVDAETDRNTHWILNWHITSILLQMKARKIIVVSDSCYSGALVDADVPTIRGGISDEKFKEVILDRFAKTQTRTLLTSGSFQPVWDRASGGGMHSVFAKAFLDVLGANDSVLEGTRLFESVEARVIKDSREMREREERLGRKPGVEGEQTPLYKPIQHAGHEGPDFVFVPAAR